MIWEYFKSSLKSCFCEEEIKVCCVVCSSLPRPEILSLHYCNIKYLFSFSMGIHDSDQVVNITHSVIKYILWVENSGVWDFFFFKYYLADKLFLKYWLSGWDHWKKSQGVEFRQNLTAHGAGEVLLNVEIFLLCFEMANTSLLFLSVECANNKKVSPLGIESFSSQNI